MQNREQNAAAAQWSDNYRVVYHFAYDVGAQKVWALGDSFVNWYYVEIKLHVFAVVRRDFEIHWWFWTLGCLW